MTYMLYNTHIIYNIYKVQNLFLVRRITDQLRAKNFSDNFQYRDLTNRFQRAILLHELRKHYFGSSSIRHT